MFYSNALVWEKNAAYFRRSSCIVGLDMAKIYDISMSVLPRVKTLQSQNHPLVFVLQIIQMLPAPTPPSEGF